MKKLLILSLLGIVLFSPILAKDKITIADEELNKIMVTTTDLKDSYEILGIVISDEMFNHYRTDKVMGKAIKQLRAKAYELHADAIICVRMSYMGSDSDFIVYGTAVRRE